MKVIPAKARSASQRRRRGSRSRVERSRKNWAAGGVTRSGVSWAAIRPRARDSRVAALSGRGTEPWPGEPRVVSRSQKGIFSVTATP